MRVIAGEARGTRLAAPKGRTIRPTVDRVRESVFNVLAPRIEGARFLDMFAGTGANGIEALSRGAAEAVFIDVGRASGRLVPDNLRRAKCASKGSFVYGNLPRDLPKLSKEIGQFSLVYADPPYDFNGYENLVDRTVSLGFIVPGAWFVLEHSSRVSIDWAALPVELIRERKYGESTIAVVEVGPSGDLPISCMDG